jgi:hypothetical protein
MSKPGFNRWTLTAVCAVLAMVAAWNVGTSKSLHSPAPAVSGDVDLDAEARVLDNFVRDLALFDKRVAESSKKSSLTRAEFDPLKRSGDDLKGRLSEVQNALRDAIRKLKTANLWEGLDATVLARITDAKLQARFRQNSFRQALDEAASTLASDAKEIDDPLIPLRNKVQARLPESNFESDRSSLALRTVRVSYSPAAAVFKASFRCRLANLRAGIGSAFTSHPGTNSRPAQNAVDCYCELDGDACVALFGGAQ